jgi:hypothetical protein
LHGLVADPKLELEVLQGRHLLSNSPASLHPLPVMPLLPLSVFGESRFAICGVPQLKLLYGTDCWSNVEEFVHGKDRLDAERGICVKKSDGFIADLAADMQQMWSNVEVSTSRQQGDVATSEMQGGFEFWVFEPLSNRMAAVDKDIACKQEIIDLIPNIS